MALRDHSIYHSLTEICLWGPESSHLALLEKNGFIFYLQLGIPTQMASGQAHYKNAHILYVTAPHIVIFKSLPLLAHCVIYITYVSSAVVKAHNKAAT